MRLCDQMAGRRALCPVPRQQFLSAVRSKKYGHGKSCTVRSTPCRYQYSASCSVQDAYNSIAQVLCTSTECLQSICTVHTVHMYDMHTLCTWNARHWTMQYRVVARAASSSSMEPSPEFKRMHAVIRLCVPDSGNWSRPQSPWPNNYTIRNTPS